MTTKDYQDFIASLSEDEVNQQGRLLNYINECYFNLYNYIKGIIYLNFVFKFGYRDNFESLNELCYGIGNEGYKLECDMMKIEQEIKEAPKYYLKDFKYSKTALVKLYKQLNGTNSFKSKCEFIKQTLISKFYLVRKYVFDDHNFDKEINFELSDDLITKLIGRKHANGDFNYLDAIHKLLHQVQDAFNLLDGVTIYYGNNDY